MKGKLLKKALAGVLSLAMVFSTGSVIMAEEAFGAEGTITVKIGNNEAAAYSSFDEAMTAVRAAEDSLSKTITLGEGTFNSASGETFRINEPNTTITGSGADATVINTGSYAVSGQAGILIQADNVTIENLRVESVDPGASGGAIKATLIGDGESSLPCLKNVTISNVVISTEAGYGLNLHGVEVADINNVTIEKAAKASVSVAKAADVTFSGLTTGKSGWETDIAVQYKDTSAYDGVSSISIENSDLYYNVVYSERPNTAAEGGDTIAIDDESMTVVERADGTKVLISKDNVILNETTGEEYVSLTEAVEEAAGGDVIVLPAGEFAGNLFLDKELTLKGAGAGETVIKFDPATKQKIEYFDGREAYPAVYSTEDLTLENLTIAGPTDQHHGIDGVLAKAGLTLNNVEIKDIRCTADGGEVCGVQYGRGVMVDGNGDVNITGSHIYDFQKQAIDLNTSGSIVIADNIIEGIGENGTITQNGIVLRGTGHAEITGNSISGLRYTADNAWSDSSYAILMYGASSADINGNTIEEVDNGIILDEEATAKINNNIINADNYGLVVYTTGSVDAADNYWGGAVEDKVWIDENAGEVTGLDNVKEEPVIDENKPGEGTGESGAEAGSDKTPKTSDPFSLGLMLALAGASGAGILAARKKIK